MVQLNDELRLEDEPGLEGKHCEVQRMQTVHAPSLRRQKEHTTLTDEFYLVCSTDVVRKGLGKRVAL